MADKTPLMQGGVAMTMNEDIADPRLMPLKEHDVVKIRQKPRGWCCELCCGCCCCCQWENEYHIVSEDKKHHLYEAREHSNFCCLNFCGTRRSFTMDFNLTEKGHEQDKVSTFQLERPFHCRLNCFPCDCCHQVIHVKSGKQPLGSVREQCWICNPLLRVEDAHGDLRYSLHGDNMCIRCHNCFFFCCRCCPEYTLDIRDDKGKSQGNVKKTFSGVAKELMTNADNFKVKFPPQSSANDRALLMGSVMLADYLYFEIPPPVEPKPE